MTLVLRSSDPDLRDLARDRPALVDASTGAPSGLRLVRWIGAGGMSAVFLAERDPAVTSRHLSDIAPTLLAVKIVKPETEHGLARLGMRSTDIARREVEALVRVRNLRPPSEFVIGLYGSGSALIQAENDSALALPWIALEHVEGSSAGTTLAERIECAGEAGVDPVRAHRLARGMIEGVRVLHRLGVIHRDLKPNNVFVAGPVDVETPKIADCGIARVEGLRLVTVQAMTPGYGAPEQMLSAQRPNERNPLVGPWSDAHALAATIFFVIAGEDWCRSEPAWNAGERRSLRTSRRLHRGFLADEHLLDALDTALRAGASPKLPPGTWDREGADLYERRAQQLFGASMFGDAPARVATVDALAAAVLPALEAVAARWIERESKEQRPVTQFRRTRTVPSDEGVQATREVVPPSPLPGGRALCLAPGEVVFQPGSFAFACSSGGLYCFSQREPQLFDVAVPEEVLPHLAETRWLARGPGGGVALVGPAHVLLFRGTDFALATLPRRASGGAVGPIVAVLGDGRAFGVVTAETEDGEGGPELWLSQDGARWSEPLLLPLGGEVNAVASGPLGFFVAGSFRGKRGRAMWLGYDGKAQVFAAGMNDKPPLEVAVAGAEGAGWAAGAGVVMRFDQSGAAVEASEGEGRPMAMGLDEGGVPWLVTEREVLRRHGAGVPLWKRYHAQAEGAPGLVAIGFHPAGVRVVDELGGGVVLRPADFATTRPVEG
ncbi:protein kinase domain-containing protein [Sorangium sp. So ce1151]|uniref:protein kinase domain-containing protein n=1 Tax=Sorangium sp. So ce1151 TaxID=3133332 RepID=UPI003F617F1C